jgi:hypothetical protein
MSLDPEVRDLLETISRAVDGMADWRMVAIGSAVDRVLAGDDDPGASADWLRDFLAERERTHRQQDDREPIAPGDARYYEEAF